MRPWEERKAPELVGERRATCERGGVSATEPGVVELQMLLWASMKRAVVGEMVPERATPVKPRSASMVPSWRSAPLTMETQAPGGQSWGLGALYSPRNFVMEMEGMPR